MTILHRSPDTSTSKNNSVLAGDSSSGFRRGISHFCMATRNTTEGVGEKEQRTNEQYELGSTQSVRRASLWHCIPCASVDYRWRVVLRNFYKLLGMPIHLWPSSSLLTVVDSGLRTHLVCLPHCPWTLSHPNGLFCCPLSTAPLRHNSPTAFSGFLFPNARLVSLGLPVASKISSSGLCLVSRQNKQKDRLLGAPPHSVSVFLMLNINYRNNIYIFAYRCLKYSYYWPRLYCYNHNVSVDMSFGLLQMFFV